VQFGIKDFSRAPSGLFVLNVYRRGELIERVEETNLIVNGSKQVHAKLLGGDVEDQSITTIAFGTNGTEPAAGNTTLTDAYTKAVDTITYPETNQVAFGFSLGADEANGKAIKEFGLFTAGGTLYARKVRSAALNKESDITLSGSWIIAF